MSFFNENRCAYILIWILVSPVLLMAIDVEASGGLQTSISSSDGYFVSTNQINTSFSTNITFIVDDSAGTFYYGEYSYSGAINGSGNYSNNTVLQLQSTTTGNITLVYRAIGTPSNETNNTVTINFDLSKIYLFKESGELLHSPYKS